MEPSISPNINRSHDYYMIPEIQKNFFMGQLDFTITSDKISHMDWYWQKRLLDVTLNHSRVKQYPMSNIYVRSFIKKLISYLENNQDIHDDFYTHLTRVMNDNDDFFYRYYMIHKQCGDIYDGDSIITIKETNRMVVDGTTGMKTWDAALVLANWALNNKERIMNEKVLELGSGVGFSGVAIADQCSPQSVYLSDFHEQVLRVICENVRINFPHLREEDSDLRETAGRKNFVVAKFSEDEQDEEDRQLSDFLRYKKDIKNIGVISLDWNQYNDIPIYLKPDVIVGADIIYDPTIIEPLCNVLKEFFGRNTALVVYIASVIRNPDTFELFLKTLDSMKFSWDKLKPETHFEYFHWNKSVKTSLLKISLPGRSTLLTKLNT